MSKHSRALTYNATSANFCMPKALEEVTKEAMDLPPNDRLALASLLLESADSASDPDAETAWDSEIRDRIRAIDEGRVIGIDHTDVMREAEQRMARCAVSK